MNTARRNAAADRYRNAYTRWSASEYMDGEPTTMADFNMRAAQHLGDDTSPEGWVAAAQLVADGTSPDWREARALAMVRQRCSYGW